MARAKRLAPLTPEQSLLLAKLASSGLSAEDAMLLGCRATTPAETVKLSPTFQALPGLYLPYLDPLKPGQPLTAWPKWPGFFRLRYLGQPNDFGQQTGKAPRYVQPPGSGVCAYFPANLGRSWAEVLGDPTVDLIITEGELKAAKACREGRPAIGLGGVHNFRSARLGVPFLKELEAVNWVKRVVFIIYDSDFRSNSHVCGALNQLAEELMLRGARPYVVPLPDLVPDGKTGLDDYLVATPSETALDELLIGRAQPLTLAQPLWRLNEQVIYVRSPGFVLTRRSGQKLAPAAFTNHAFSQATAAELVVKDNGVMSMKPVSAAAQWLKWPLRAEASKLEYRPGGGQELESLHPGEPPAWNLWPGWGCQAVRGDVSLFQQLLKHLFTGAEPQALQWFLRWLAYPLQYPGTKLFTAAMLHGVAHGTGKSQVGYTMGQIYGKNFTEIKQEDLHANFNEWAMEKQFILADDVTGSDKRQDADLLKKLVTQRELRVNEKFIPSYVVRDCVNYLFTSNQPDAFFLEDNDRRFFIHEVVVGPLSEEFYAEYDLWLSSRDAAPAIFDYLLKLDLGDFNPAAPALVTAAKERMISDVKSDLGAWVRRLLLDPATTLRVGQVPLAQDLFTNRELLALYDPAGKTGTTANGLGRELRRAGVPQALGGKPLKGPSGQDRYYIIRHREKWLQATQPQLLKHLDAAKK